MKKRKIKLSPKDVPTIVLKGTSKSKIAGGNNSLSGARSNPLAYCYGNPFSSDNPNRYAYC